MQILFRSFPLFKGLLCITVLLDTAMQPCVELQTVYSMKILIVHKKNIKAQYQNICKSYIQYFSCISCYNIIHGKVKDTFNLEGPVGMERSIILLWRNTGFCFSLYTEPFPRITLLSTTSDLRTSNPYILIFGRIIFYMIG